MSFFDESVESLQFSTFEPGAGQRWSTWPAVIPTHRGPAPHPDWVVTSAAAVDTELGIVKTGKEADLFLLERAVPGDPDAACLLAAKRYRSPDQSDFHRSAAYQEGRRMRNTRDARAVQRGSAHGRAVAAVQWAGAEFEALCRMWSLGVPVPYPVQIDGTEVLMEFIGDGNAAAPRLAETRPDAADARDRFEQVVEILRGLARAGFAHGDLSPYNLLVHRDRVVVIDLPQLVDVAANPNGPAMLQRDCHNVCEWFVRRGVVADEDELFADLIGEAFGARGW
ncbi:MAG: serine protein kinase RIO [Amnibacterium sp.]